MAVADDGFGMSARGRPQRALERHATSKLARVPTTWPGSQSFGFRGRGTAGDRLGLPSLLPAHPAPGRRAVGHLSCAWKAAGSFGAQREAVGGPEGTRVEVADLFGGSACPAQVPEEAEATEWGHVADWLARAALALPQVHFELAREDRAPRSRCGPATRRAGWIAIAAVLSARVAEGLRLLRVEHSEGGADPFEGFFSRPDAAPPHGLGDVYLCT